MNLDDFSYVEEDRRYINPQTALDESNEFMDNLRASQARNTQEIAQDTYNLGTEVPSNLGGLAGSESYFNSRYQTPQTNSLIADLRTTAQAQALGDALKNELAKAQQKYNNAYKAAARRGGGGGTLDPTTPGTEADITEEGADPKNSIWNITVNDDAVYYGLYKLTRNEGESDQDWEYRSKQWLDQMDKENFFRRKDK